MLLSIITSYTIYLNIRIFDDSFYLELDDSANYAILVVWGLIWQEHELWLYLSVIFDLVSLETSSRYLEEG